ncbi:hypothetical protein [Crossiella sp. CA198]
MLSAGRTPSRSRARIWYLLDEDRHTVWVQAACAGHPKGTEI